MVWTPPFSAEHQGAIMVKVNAWQQASKANQAYREAGQKLKQEAMPTISDTPWQGVPELKGAYREGKAQLKQQAMQTISETPWPGVPELRGAYREGRSRLTRNPAMVAIPERHRLVCQEKTPVEPDPTPAVPTTPSANAVRRRLLNLFQHGK